MKILLAFPPLWSFNLAPMLSLPLLSGMLKKQGHDVEIMDINSLFMNFVLSRDFLGYCNAHDQFLKRRITELQKAPQTTKSLDLLMSYRSNFILLDNIRKKGLFSFLMNYPVAQRAIAESFSKQDSVVFENNLSGLKLNLRNIFAQALKSGNALKQPFFYVWEQQIIKRITDISPDLIGFSIYDDLQLDWTLNFAKELKKKSNAKIILGGTDISQRRNNLPENIFDTVDIINYGEGEEVFSRIAKGTPLENVPNIIFKDNDGNIKTNDMKDSAENIFYKPNYKGIDFNQYFLPKPVLQIESSRGCYWHRCIFCTFMDCSKYKVKNVDALIEEIKEYVNVYNIRHFFFTDSAIHPNYARKFSEKLRENNLKIYYLTFLRLDKEFDEDLLKLMYDTGLRIAMWGVESGSERILNMYDKGTEPVRNAKIINTAHEIGIYNYCWLMTKFPKETKEDIDKTRDFLTQNYDAIDLVSFHEFTLMPTSPIEKRKQEFGLGNYNFKEIEVYNPPEEINDYANRLKQDMFYLYDKKIRKYPSDLSFILLKLSEEKP